MCRPVRGRPRPHRGGRCSRRRLCRAGPCSPRRRPVRDHPACRNAHCRRLRDYRACPARADMFRPAYPGPHDPASSRRRRTRRRSADKRGPARPRRGCPASALALGPASGRSRCAECVRRRRQGCPGGRAAPAPDSGATGRPARGSGSDRAHGSARPAKPAVRPAKPANPAGCPRPASHQKHCRRRTAGPTDHPAWAACRVRRLRSPACRAHRRARAA
jgi:hypothetical protein